VADTTIEQLTAAYLDLLAIPHNAAARTNAQRAMIILRDMIAERSGRTAEDVQTTCEAIAEDDPKN